jgi:hypothetical protein
VERSEAEAIYDSGREACVAFLMRLEGRVRALEAKASASSREKAKELLRNDGEKRNAGGQPGHPGAGRELLGEDQMAEIVEPRVLATCG